MAMAAPGMAALGIASSVAGGITGAIGAETTAGAQSNMYDYQAGVAKVNAAVATQDAAYARDAGGVQSQEAGLKGRAEQGSTRAGIAAGNVDINQGSGARVLKSETEITQQNEAVITGNAAKRAYSFDVKAAGDTATAGADYAASTTSLESGDINATASIIGSAGSVASKWGQFGQSFGTGTGSPGGVNPDSLLGRGVYAQSIFT